MAFVAIFIFILLILTNSAERKFLEQDLFPKRRRTRKKSQRRTKKRTTKTSTKKRSRSKK